MSDFEKILIQPTGYKNGAWQTSALGDWLFISDGWSPSEGEFRINKSKKGNPFMIRVNRDSFHAFLEYLNAVNDKLGGSSETNTTSQNTEVPDSARISPYGTVGEEDIPF